MGDPREGVGDPRGGGAEEENPEGGAWGTRVGMEETQEVGGGGQEGGEEGVVGGEGVDNRGGGMGWGGQVQERWGVGVGRERGKGRGEGGPVRGQEEGGE